VLGCGPGEHINPRQGFFDLGMDSLQANELRNRLQASLESPLPPTLTFKFPTVAALVDHLTQVLFAEPQSGSSADFPADSHNQRVSDEGDLGATINRELVQLEKLLGS
jgi:acyl carrier protein